MQYRLYNSKGELLVKKLLIEHIIRWIQENEYFEKNPDEVLKLGYRTLDFCYDITKDMSVEDITKKAEDLMKFY